MRRGERKNGVSELFAWPRSGSGLQTDIAQVQKKFSGNATPLLLFHTWFKMSHSQSDRFDFYKFQYERRDCRRNEKISILFFFFFFFLPQHPADFKTKGDGIVAFFLWHWFSMVFKDSTVSQHNTARAILTATQDSVSKSVPVVKLAPVNPVHLTSFYFYIRTGYYVLKHTTYSKSR